MKIKKIYFNRMYDQWRGEPLYVEDGLDDDKLYVRIMDVPNYKEGAVNVIIADYKDLIGGTYTVLGQMDFDKKLAIFKIPLSILSNNGIYEVVFSLSFNAKDKEGLLLKTPIQTFEIIDTIEADNEAIAQDPHYPILVDLINQLAEYKVDTSVFPTREEMMKAIEENLNENSQYGCMPTIDVFKIDKNVLREATDDDEPYNNLHLGEKKYVFKEPIYDYESDNYIKGVEHII